MYLCTGSFYKKSTFCICLLPEFKLTSVDLILDFEVNLMGSISIKNTMFVIPVEDESVLKNEFILLITFINSKVKMLGK